MKSGAAGLFHALPLAWGADPPPADPDSAAASTYYQDRLPAQLGGLTAHPARYRGKRCTAILPYIMRSSMPGLGRLPVFSSLVRMGSVFLVPLIG